MDASPLGTPILWIASSSPAMAGALAAFVQLHLRGTAPSQLPATNVLVMDHPENLISQLDRQPLRDLANSLVIVDLAAMAMRTSWNVENIDPNRFQPSTLFMRYPEIYWIFLVQDMPDF